MNLMKFSPFSWQYLVSTDDVTPWFCLWQHSSNYCIYYLIIPAETILGHNDQTRVITWGASGGVSSVLSITLYSTTSALLICDPLLDKLYECKFMWSIGVELNEWIRVFEILLINMYLDFKDTDCSLYRFPEDSDSHGRCSRWCHSHCWRGSWCRSLQHQESVGQQPQETR